MANLSNYNFVSGNTATFTGNITGNYFIGNGSQLTGVPTITDVANYLPTYSGNLDNVDVVDANTLKGEGGNIGNIQGANVTGTVANATVAASANSVAGANVTGTVASATVAASANSVAGANVSGQVANALVAGTVYTNAQPNITSVGTLTSLDVTGNIIANVIGNTATYLYGDGSNVTNLTLDNSIVNGTSNVIVAANANVTISTTGGNTWTFDTTGNLILPGNSTISDTVAYGAVPQVGMYLTASIELPVSLNSDSFAQLYWNPNIADTANFDPYYGGPIYNWASVDNAGFTVATKPDPGTPRNSWVFDLDGVLTAAGDITTPGNVSANYFIGNGSELTDLPVAAIIANGTSNVSIAAADGPVLMFDGGDRVASISTERVAIGDNAGITAQNIFTVAVGFEAGKDTQGIRAVAVGYQAGTDTQGANAIAIGATAAATAQGDNSIAVGSGAGSDNQGNIAIAIGLNSGVTTQGALAIAIGGGAGLNTQGSSAVAIGADSGSDTQGENAIAIGSTSGTSTQGANAVAIGYNSAGTAQGENSIAIGQSSGQANQGTNSVAIGAYAGETDQPVNSIIINASGSTLDGTESGLYINPVRNDTGNTTNVVYYNDTTKEVTYGPGATPYGNTEVAAYLPTYTGNLDNVSSVGNATTVLFGDGANITGLPAQYGNAEVSAYLASGSDTAGFLTFGDIQTTTGNGSFGGNVDALAFSGDGAQLTNIDGSEVTGTVANATFATTSGSADSVAGANVTGTVANATFATTSGSADSVAGANVSGQVANALVSGTVYTAAQPNITSVGTLSTLEVTGNVLFGNANIGNLVVTGTTTTANVSDLDVANATIIISSGANALVSNGAGLFVGSESPTVGSLTYLYSSNSWNSSLLFQAPNFTTPGNLLATTVVAATIGNASSVLFGDGSNIAGLPAPYTDTDVSLYLASGVDSDGYTTTGNITTTANIVAANIGNSATVLRGDGGLISNLSIPAGTQIVSGTSNVSIAASGGNITMAVGGNAAFTLSATTVAVGANAAANAQGGNSVAIGLNAGANTQAANSVAVGSAAGQTSQGTNSVVIGYLAGQTSASANTVAIGANAASNAQALGAVAVGFSAGANTQSVGAVAIGYLTASATQGARSVAVGQEAAATNQGSQSVAVGLYAGQTSQGANTVAIGAAAGQTSQGASAIAIGVQSGLTSQGIQSIAIGQLAGSNTQSASAIAIGLNAGSNTQGTSSVAIGRDSGVTLQGTQSVAVGLNAGSSNQGTQAVAVGWSAGGTSQGNTAIAIGQLAGQTSQGLGAVAIGSTAARLASGTRAISIGDSAAFSGSGTGAISMGYQTAYFGSGSGAVAIGYQAAGTAGLQGNGAIAIGQSAGGNTQGNTAVAIGSGSGVVTQGIDAVAIGRGAGANAQGANSIAIGTLAGNLNQPANSIIINASGAALNGTNAGFYVNPVRNDTGNIAQVVTYNTSTKEVTYANTINLAGNISGSNLLASNAITVGATVTVLPNSVATFGSNANSYTQITFQNLSNGADATSDIVLTTDNGNDTVNFADFGIINSAYDPNTPTNSLGNVVFASDAYLYAQGNTGNTAQSGGNLVLGATVSTKNVKIFAGGNSNSFVTATFTSTAANLKALIVQGTSNLGAVGNVTITGGTSGQVLTTNGSNVLSWTTVSGGGGGASISNGTTSVAIDGSGGNIDFTVAGNSFGTISQTQVAIGDLAGVTGSANTVALGTFAGYFALANTITIGAGAGQGHPVSSSLGANSIAIGVNASRGGLGVALPGNTIVLNATGANLNPAQANSFFVSPVRNDTGNTTNVVYYNTTSKEVTYGPASASAIISNGTSNVRIATSAGNVTMAVNGNSVATFAAANVILNSVRNDTGNVTNAVYYNTTTKEITYSILSQIANGGTGIFIPSSDGTLEFYLGGYAGGGITYDGFNGTSIVIGAYSSQSGNGTIALGSFAGNSNQGLNSIAIGQNTGQTNQGTRSIAVGPASGSANQGNSAVALGWGAGFTGQGANSIAIGQDAGQTNQPSNSIILNATGGVLNGTNSGLYVAPVRNDTGNIAQVVTYNTSTKEVTYANTINLAGNVSAGNVNVTGNVTGSSSNVTLVSGSYSWTFDNTSTVSFPGPARLAVYANATARDAAITSPQTGMMVYVTGVGMQVRGATAWNTITGTGT